MTVKQLSAAGLALAACISTIVAGCGNREDTVASALTTSQEIATIQRNPHIPYGAKSEIIAAIRSRQAK